MLIKITKMKTDVLIIGSGPIGATYSRIIAEHKPATKIVMIDLGPKISDKIGQHVKNITDPKTAETAQILSQGNKKEPYPMISVAERAAAVQRGDLRPEFLARAGTHLVIDEIADLQKNEMPALSLSSNIGGMGVHWTCACPRPGNEERIPFIPASEMDDALTKAEEILSMRQDAFPMNEVGQTILNVLNQTLGTAHSPTREAQAMPLACGKDAEGNRYWTATDTILKDTLENINFEIRSETICRKLIHSEGKITGAEIEDLTSGIKEMIEAKIVIVAADAIRTPQLLWASGIRPKALGHYLNEHPFIFTFVELNIPIAQSTTSKSHDPLTGVFWVPFDAPNHPFHGQIMHMDLSPMKTTVSDISKHIVGLGWGCLKEVKFDDQIVFSEIEKDYLGMPKMTFKYKYSKNDLVSIEAAKQFQAKVIASFGKEIENGQQTLMPAGSSLHYEGTTRMGAENNSESVCDTFGQVWNFENLFVGGNGVIPMATTSNPTLTSVALAVRSAEKIVEKL
jgi:choline dehydrogenase-like flavoprotein